MPRDRFYKITLFFFFPLPLVHGWLPVHYGLEGSRQRGSQQPAGLPEDQRMLAIALSLYSFSLLQKIYSQF